MLTAEPRPLMEHQDSVPTSPGSPAPPSSQGSPPATPPGTPSDARGRADGWIVVEGGPESAGHPSKPSGAPAGKRRARRSSSEGDAKKRRSQRLVRDDGSPAQAAAGSTDEGAALPDEEHDARERKEGERMGRPRGASPRKSPAPPANTIRIRLRPSASSSDLRPSTEGGAESSLSSAAAAAVTAAAAKPPALADEAQATLSPPERDEPASESEPSNEPAQDSEGMPAKVTTRKSSRRPSITSAPASAKKTAKPKDGDRDREAEEEEADEEKKEEEEEERPIKRSPNIVRLSKSSIMAPKRAEEDSSPEPTPAGAAVEEEPFQENSGEGELVNNEFCSACSGGGSLICCEACPKSFHFTCADPPIDEHNVPDDKWFCNECKVKLSPAEGEREREITTMAGIWKRLTEKMDGINPRAFTLPKRIRNFVTDPQQQQKLANKKSALSKRSADRRPSINSERGSANEEQQQHMQLSNHHGATTIRRMRDRVSEGGFCHACNRSSGGPSNLLIHCDDCSLQWHLDCLPYPLAVYPSSHRHWACPLHLTADNLVGVLPADVAARSLEASKVSVRISDWPQQAQRRPDLSLLPETSVRLQFGWTAGASPFTERSGCAVPPSVQDAYHQVRSMSTRQVRLLSYYEGYSYTDQAIETDLVI